MGLVYYVMNIKNGKIYIGQTSKGLGARIEKHLALSRCNRGGYHLHRAIKRDGINSFVWGVIIDNIVRSEEIGAIENYYIMEWDTINTGYNEMEGGLGGVITARAKEKIGEKSIKMWADPIMREKINAARMKALAREDVKQKIKKNAERMKTDKEWKSKRREGLLKAFSSLEYKEKKSIIMKKVWEDPQKRQAAREKALAMSKTKEWRDAFEAGYRVVIDRG